MQINYKLLISLNLEHVHHAGDFVIWGNSFAVLLTENYMFLGQTYMYNRASDTTGIQKSP